MDAPGAVGTGGGLRYVTEEPSPDMVNQELPHSCQVACARQLLKDVGVAVSEAELLARIGYLEGWGTAAEDVAPVLSDLHPGLGHDGGSIPPEAVSVLFDRGPLIANVRTDRGTVHAVIVDGLDGDTVRVRDPWGLKGPGSGTGTKATLSLQDFLEHWQWALNKAVIPNRRK